MDKTLLVGKCLTMLSERIKTIQEAIRDAELSLTDETKSSAGDKYETSREMIQQDLSRLEKQLKIALDDRAILNRIDLTQYTSSVGLGSLIYTDDGIAYFIAIGIGKVEVDQSTFYVVSLASPLGQILQGKRKGHFFEINNIRREIKEVY